MRGAAAGALLVVLGAALRAPGLIAVGTLIGVAWVLGRLWSRYGLRRLTYERRLGSVRAAVGEEIGLELVVRNLKALPVPWLQVDDLVSEGAVVAGRQSLPSEQPGVEIIRTTWTLGWFQRVTRRLTITADRRGVYDFRAVQLQVADVFSRSSALEERPLPLRYRVVPRAVPAHATRPLSQVPGSARAPHGLFEEPTLFAGVRPYQAGDPLRRIHWKASGRLGRPVSRRFDPGHERELVIALDAQTVPGPFWVMQYDEELIEGLCTATLSLARSLIGAGVGCGLAANGYSLHPGRTIYLAPSGSPVQVARIADELASLSRWARLPFSSLVGDLGRRLPPSTRVVAISAQDPRDVLPVLRRLGASGRAVGLLAYGPDGEVAAQRARAQGISAGVALLSPDWRTADALTLVG